MEIKNRIILKRGKEQSVLRFHPWVFSGAVEKIEGNPVSGDWVNIYDYKNNFLGAGHYQQSSITARILSFQEMIPGIDFWKIKLSEALNARRNIGLPQEKVTNVFRLVHGEGDGLPGLVIDVYDKVAVIQSHSSGMHKDRNLIAQALKEIMGEEITAIYYKSENDKESGEYLIGESTVPVVVSENGTLFKVNWVEGQKTGFFIDQRDNRQLLMKYAYGKKVLNTFCYTGGFSVYALKAGAELVHSVDSSKSAIGLTDENVRLNFRDEKINHESFPDDVFKFLEENKNQYNLIILDPPAFAKHRDAKSNAMKGYQRLNHIALKNIMPGGIIFTFSCSQVINRELFYNTIVSAAILAKRKVRVLHHLSQAPDHPVSIFHSEGEYLKGLVLEVD